MATQQVHTLRQVMAAANVSSTTLDNWRSGTPTKKALPTVKVGHFVYIPAGELKEWAKTHGIKLDRTKLGKSQPLPEPVAKPAKDTKPARKSAKKRTTH